MAAADPADLQASGETFEVALLFVGKVDFERFNFHGARRNSCGHDWWRQRNWVDRAELDSALAPRFGSCSRSDQLRCCGNSSWT